MKVSGRRGLARAAGALAGCVLMAGCATVPHRPAPPVDPALAGWDALGAGRSAEARARFAARLQTDPGDPIARVGRASLAYERGEALAAAEDYAAALATVSKQRANGARDSALDDASAVLAAGRVRDLFGELGPADRARVAATLRPVETARAPGLPWLARLELARLGDEIARANEDASAISQGAAADGCANWVFDAGSLGSLAHLDLDRPAPTAPPADWRLAVVSGCHADLPPAADGRGAARVLTTAVDVPGGDYAVVLDFADEARLSIDGGPPVAHGAAGRYGAHLEATRVSLSAGPHALEVRLAGGIGAVRVGLAVLPLGAAGPARFVDPRLVARHLAARPPVTAPLPAMLAAVSPGPAPAPGAPLLDYAVAFAAGRTGAVDDLAAALGRLDGRPRFALGLALAGELARADPTRPAAFARDEARRFLRAAATADQTLARPWQALATIELDDERPRDAITDARQAQRIAPGWWAPELLLSRALAARGLDFDAAAALDAAATKGGVEPDAAPCPVVEARRRQAEERRQLTLADQLTAALAACGGDVDARVDRLRARGEDRAAIALLEKAVVVDPDRDDLVGDLGQLYAAAGRTADALRTLQALVARDPEDPLRRVRLADSQVAAGRLDDARRTIGAALADRPDVPEVRRSARALGVPLPLDAFRVDGRSVIRDFEQGSARSGGRSSDRPTDKFWAGASATMVLDRAVTRVFPSGATMTLTHQIVRVESKDAIDRWGEIEVPPGAEILTLRADKSDGTTREPEEIAGKDTISVDDLAIGDYVEWELLETKAPSEALAPGFLAERFFFQSFDAPLARSELVLVTPRGLAVDVDARAGAPRPEVHDGADGTRITTFAAHDVPQLFAERSAVPAIEYVPSVRPSSGVGWNAWSRFLAEELHGAVRASPAVRALAHRLAPDGGADRGRAAAAIVDWVTENVEATDELAEPAAFTLARGQGSRVALALALAAELKVPAAPVLARSLLTADVGAPTPPQELDDFADTLLELDVGRRGHPAFVDVDLRLRHAAFGYLPPGLDGARTLSLADGRFGTARSTAGADRRTIDMTIRLDERGSGVAVATEDLAGWPALEWAELIDRFGADRTRLREDFEQRWLGVQFPGARLRDLEVDLPHDAAGRVGTARLKYSFVSNHLAVPVDRVGGGGREMRIEPTFFRSQPGRRFAAEPQRSTALMLGFDVPTRMTATVELPGAARLDASGPGGDLVVARAGGYRFVESRDVEPGRPNVLVLRRESTLPIMRVPPGEYPGVAADLRRVDGAEQAEIRIRLGGSGAHVTGSR